MQILGIVGSTRKSETSGVHTLVQMWNVGFNLTSTPTRFDFWLPDKQLL
jgi:hypothetical protein